MPRTGSSGVTLLTGAGFTKTFGGYLGSEMWARIFNQPEAQQYPRIRRKMLSDLNFESVYSHVVESPRYTPVEKHSFTVAIQNAYKSMHDYLLSEDMTLIREATAACHSIVSRFAATNERPGFVFTLNQDLFIERWFEDVGQSVIIMPGIKPGPRWFNPGSGPWIDSTAHLPNKADVKKIMETFYTKNDKRLIYLKLHGSYGWKRVGGPKIGDLMIIGKAKSKLIKREPVLRWYFRLFEEVLSRAKMLVVIGYGFGDKHINKVILRNSRLMMSVICPLEPKVFKSNLLRQGAVGRKLWKKVANYYQGDIRDLYYRDTRELTLDGQTYFSNLSAR